MSVLLLLFFFAVWRDNDKWISIEENQLAEWDTRKDIEEKIVKSEENKNSILCARCNYAWRASAVV